MLLAIDSLGGLFISTTRAPDTARPTGTKGQITTLQFALAAAELAANTRCENVILLDLRGRSPVTEFFLIATGTSPRQMRTVVDELKDLGKTVGFAAWRMDGYESARWIVLDCVHVVVHVFETESRDFYDLELLWGDSPRVDWRKELGLPPESKKKPLPKESFDEEDDAMDEENRLEGRNDEDEIEIEEDQDEEDAEIDAPIVMELPDESTGSNSVQFVEIDPPATRRRRGRAVYPTPIEEQEDTTAEERSMGPVRDLGGSAESLDEDDQQRAAEIEADGDVEAVSKEDLPQSRQRRRPMGGVSASLSSMSIADPGEEDQEGDTDPAADRTRRHRDQVPKAQEAPAKTVRVRRGATAAARGRKAKAGVAKGRGQPSAKRAKKAAPKKAAPKKTSKAKPAAKGVKKKNATRAAAKKGKKPKKR